MYMSYCRFEGTYAELRACLADVEEHVNEEAEYEVSHREIENFCNMVEFFHEFLCKQELLDENGDLDMDQLHCIADAMAKSYDEEEDE